MKASSTPAPKTLGLPKWMVGLTDIALVSLAVYLSFVLIDGTLKGYQLGPLLLMLPALAVATVLIFSALGLYTRQRSGFSPVLRAVFTGVLGIFLFTIIFAFMTRTFVYQRLVFGVAFLLQLAFLPAWRFLHWRLENWIFGRQKILVVGEKEAAAQAQARLGALPGEYFKVEKVLAPDEEAEFSRFLPEVDAVVMAGSLTPQVRQQVITESFNSAKDLLIVPGLYEIILTRAQINQVQDTFLIECSSLSLTPARQFLKRFFDLALAALLAVPALPLVLICALAVAVTSPGPAIYLQERVGLKGKVFTLYKLRTMVVGAESKSGPVFAGEEDDRVTSVGRFLRTARLDELPQLFNVLRGDLSMVGPRPERPFFVARFEKELPGYSLRHLVKPGITGLAQVAGYYASNTQDKLKHDLYYLADYSLLLDLKILLLTVPTLFNRQATQGFKSEAGG